MKARAESEAGFSLIELMVAMVITLVVTGAIYGLMASGQSAFKRDPEITERQQNIRVAMDLIQRDIHLGGMKMGPFVQAFTDGYDDAGPEPSVIVPGESTDILELFGNDGLCPDVPLSGGSGVNLNAATGFPPCYEDRSLVMLIWDNPARSSWGFAFNLHAGETKFNFPSPKQPDPPINANQLVNLPGDFNSPYPDHIAYLQYIRYEIAQEADGIPGLWRSSSGGRPESGGAYLPAGPGLADWQLVARGIEDLQLRYRDGGGAWVDDAPLVVDGNYSTIVREVEVRLSARTAGTNIAGERLVAGAAVGAAIRGQLASVTSPRAALFALASDDAAASGQQWE